MGVLNEGCWILFNDCIKQGFTISQSMQLTVAFLQTSLLNTKNESGGDE
jgi:hypothetical protein